MKPNKDHIKHVFSSKLKDFEPELPSSVWEKIEADLPVAPTVKKSLAKIFRHTIFAWTGVAAAVVLLALLFMPQRQDAERVAVLIDDSAIEDSRLVKEQDRDADSRQFDMVDRIVEPTKQQTSYASQAKVEIKSRAESEDRVVSVGESLPKKKVSAEVEVVATTTDNSSPAYVADAGSAESFEPQDADFDRDMKARIAAFEAEGEKAKSILADNGIVVKSSSRGFVLGLSGGSGLSKPEEATNSLRYASIYTDQAITKQKKEKLTMEHNQPINFGIAINKKITKRLSIESGLVYTYISARIKVDPNMEFRQNDLQYFHYLGIPLSLNYKFANLKKFEFYTSVGGLIQKDFYGGLNSDSNVDDLINFEKTSKRRISQDRPQFSATALLGVSYPLYNKMSVYTSFGGAYYFDAGNTYQAIFSDKKWLFNVNLGVKFGF